MVPHIILVMDDHDLVLKPMVTWGSRMTYLRSPIYTVYIYICMYGKCLGFVRKRNHDRQRIIIIISKPFLKLFKIKIEV